MHQDGHLSETEMNILRDSFNNMSGISSRAIDKIIYLRTTPEMAMEGVKRRNREEEKGMDLEYLRGLHARHEDWLIKKKFPLAVPVTVITIQDGDGIRNMIERAPRQLLHQIFAS